MTARVFCGKYNVIKFYFSDVFADDFIDSRAGNGKINRFIDHSVGLHCFGEKSFGNRVSGDCKMTELHAADESHKYLTVVGANVWQWWRNSVTNTVRPTSGARGVKGSCLKWEEERRIEIENLL
jgi:hypothetical protein